MKTKAMKKLLLLTACLTLLVLTVVGVTLTASATTYNGTCGDNLTWELDTATRELTISGTGAMADDYYSSVPWYSYRSYIKTVTIDYGVTSIGSNAFYDCSSLTSVTIPDSVTWIGYQAFCNCSSLTSITIPDSVTGIGSYAFSSCSSLTSITIPDGVTSIGDNAFYGCTNLIQKENGVHYVDKWVIGCDKSVTSVTLREDTVGIGDYAFRNCSSLTSITIPDSVISIGSSAFYSCNSLTYITYNNGKYLGNDANPYVVLMDITDTSITDFTIPDGTNIIYDYAFESCYSLTSITIPDSVTSIGYCAFRHCDSLTSITIPDSVTSIGYDAFYDCSNLTSITVDANNPNYCSIDGNLYNKNTTTLIQYAIGKTDMSFAIPNSVTSIGDAAFSYCSSLTNITIPDSVTNIGYIAFSNCSSLTCITISNRITDIGMGVFRMCEKLEKIIYCGTPIQWNAITKGPCWDDLNADFDENDTYTLQYHSFVNGVCEYCGASCALGHTPSTAVKENRIESTCTEKGSYDSVVYCEVCGEELSRETITILALGHAPADAVEENRVEPTCIEKGSYDSVVYCSVCPEEISRETFEIPALGHSYGDWEQHDLTQHKQICINNDCDDTVYATHTWTDGVCEYCGAIQPVINNVNIAIGQDITVKYYALVPDSYTNLTMKFTMGDKTATVSGVATGVENQYVFSFEGVSPQCMGDAITAKLYSNGQLIAEKGAYTVKTYLEALINGDFDEKTKTIAKDTLIYGGAAQAYKNYNTDALVSDGITGSSYTLPGASGIELSNGTGATFTNATVWFDNINKIRVKFIADSTENLIVKINGVETEYVLGDDGKYHVHTEALLATEFDKFFTFEIYINGSLVSSLKYSVNSYVYTMLSSTNEPMKNLAIALYNYGYSADIYNGTPQTPMLSEEEAAKADPTKSFQGEEHLFTPFG